MFASQNDVAFGKRAIPPSRLRRATSLYTREAWVRRNVGGGGLLVCVFACVFYGKMRINGKERVAIMGFFLYNKLIEFLLFVRELACI